MSSDSSNRDLRLWPGVVLAGLLVLLRYLLPRLVPATALFVAPIAGMVLGVLILLWWLLASRAPASERWMALGAIVAGVVATTLLLHPTIAQSAGGQLFPLYAVPLLGLALVVWAWVSRGWSEGARRVSLPAAVVVVCLPFTLLQSPGLYGGGKADFDWRWAATAEDRLVAAGGAPHLSDAGSAVGEIRWPGFRGPSRDSTVRGTRFATNWEVSPPEEMWRRPVGPGWSSFAVAGDVLYTQEQRGELEVVSAYRLSTGEPVWEHTDETRFWEAMGGVGPRATPTLGNDRVYVLGATGRFNALDAASGAVVWARDLAADTGAAVPTWGFSGSPLVLSDRVIVAASGVMAAYGLDTGEPIWTGAGTNEGEAYSSPHLATFGGTRQVVLLSPEGASGISVDDGSVLWQHERAGSPIVQPALVDGGFLMGAAGMSGGTGVAKLDVRQDASGWSVEQVWESNRLKPYFNDLVIHDGHAYGFDGSILAAIDMESGKRAWKGGRYGHGQLLLLADQDLLLVLSEGGDLVLVSATPEGHEEVAKFQALDGKTWNHPVIVDDVLLVRNAEEMAAFRLASGV